MKRLVFIFCAICALFATSCQKSIDNTPTEEPKVANLVKYQIDGQEVVQSDFFKQLLPNGQVSLRDVTTDMTTIANAYRVLCEVGKSNGKQSYDIINVFSSDDEFYKYADANNHPNERTYDLVEQDLADYAVSSGAISTFELTGVVPQSYIDYMDVTLSKFGFAPSTAPQVQTRSLTNWAYKGCNGTGNSFPIRGYAWLGIIGYDNQISSFLPVGFIGGASDVFDRTFFRSRMTRIWSWAMTRIDFCSYPYTWLDDKASSWTSF